MQGESVTDTWLLGEGDTLDGRYKILGQVGRGGMGQILKAYDRNLERLVAIKILNPEYLGNDEVAQRLVKEAQHALRLGDTTPHVVKIHDIQRQSGTGSPYIVMELLEGRPLTQYIHSLDDDRFSAAEALPFLRQICDAVAAAHRNGLVHRDLKPDNVFVTRAAGEAFVKILDFGIAKPITDGGSNTLAGTPEWMAPEQVGAESIGKGVDIFALGLLAFWMLTGKQYRSFTNDDVMSFVKEPLTVKPSDVAGARALPDGFDEWFAKCTAFEAKARFTSVGKLLAELEQILAPDRQRVSVPAPSSGVVHISVPAPGTSALPSGSSAWPAVPAPTRPKGKLVLAVGAAALVSLGSLLFRASEGKGREPNAGATSVASIATALSEPRLDFVMCGSESVGNLVGKYLAWDFLETLHPTCRVEERTSSGKDGKTVSTLSVLPKKAGSAACPPVSVRIDAVGSGHAFETRCNKAQIRMSSADYEPARLGEELNCRERDRPRCVHLLGFDAVAIGVSRAGDHAWKQDGISKSQLAALFVGGSKSWADIGGTPGDVALCGRGADSGTTLDFLAFLAKRGARGEGPPHALQNVAPFPTHEAVVDCITKGSASSRTLGFFGYTYIARTSRDEVKLLRVSAPETDGEPVKPTDPTIAMGTYPIVRRLRLFRTVMDAQGSKLLDAFWAHLSTPRAAERSAEFLVNPNLDPTGANPGERQLVVSFLFASGGKAEFANPVDADEDVDRVIDYLQAAAVRSGAVPRLVLHGYEDRKPSRNLALPRERARFVASAIERRIAERGELGPALRAFKFGEDAVQGPKKEALGSGDPESPKSRRVEIWVAPSLERP